MTEDCYVCGDSPEDCECEGGFVECTCVRIDVDMDDARGCRVHGDGGVIDRRTKQREGMEEAAFWRGMAEF